MRAVLENDLKEAFGRADMTNRTRMYEILSFLYNDAPIGSWGHKGVVKKWLATFPRKGAQDEKTEV